MIMVMFAEHGMGHLTVGDQLYRAIISSKLALGYDV